MTSVRLMQAILPDPAFQQFPTVVVLATCTWGIISLWAATSRRPWFIRALVLSLMLSCVVAIPAYEPVLYFLLQSAVVVIGVTIWSTRFDGSTLSQRSGRSSFFALRFSLRELLFVTVFVGLFLSVLARTDRHPPMVWASLFSTGLASGIVTLLAAWLSLAAATKRRRLDRILSAVLLAALCGVPAAGTDGILRNFPDWHRTPAASYDPAWIGLFLGVLLGISIWLLFYSWARREQLRRLGCPALFAWSIVLAWPCVDIYFALPSMVSKPDPYVIENNGFTEIDEAATQLYVVSGTFDDPKAFPAAQIRMGLDKNTDTLAAIRRGLNKECVRQPDYDRKTDWLSSTFATIGRMRSLARMLMAEAELAKREGRIDDAIVSYLDIMRLSRATEKGALAVDALVARAIEAMAFVGISEIRDQLTPAQRRTIAEALSDSDRQREDPQTIYDRDVVWGRFAYGWRALLSTVLGQLEPMEDGLNQSLHRMQTLTRLFIVEFAIEDYQLERARLPVSLKDLKLGADLLRDPFSADGDPLEYRIVGDGFLVYSIGPDGDDDDGRPSKDVWTGDGDYRLDALYSGEED